VDTHLANKRAELRPVPDMTDNVIGGTLNLAQSIRPGAAYTGFPIVLSGLIIQLL